MEDQTSAVVSEPRIELRIAGTDRDGATFAEDVRRGLAATPKELPPKYFYDEVGSQLFEQICALPEYYLTRTERAILAQYAAEIAAVMDAAPVLVELGSGSSSKTRLLIEAFLKRHGVLHYVPVDLSPSILEESVRSLAEDYPALRITAHVAEYFTALRALTEEEWSPKLIIFLGSNIGNFGPGEAEEFLATVRNTMTESDRMLVGIDLIKEREVLQAAYDDRQGITARFNLNVLARINRELGGHFDLNKFRHLALFNEEHSRMEIYLESRVAHSVRIDAIDLVADFAGGERIHTEDSHKFSAEQINALASNAGLSVERAWYDDRHWFGVHLLKRS